MKLCGARVRAQSSSFVIVHLTVFSIIENAFGLKHIRHATVGSERAAASVEYVTNVAAGTIFIVGKSFDYYGYAVGAVTFVNDGLVVDAPSSPLAFLMLL